MERRERGRRHTPISPRRASAWEHAEAQQAIYIAPWAVFLFSGVIGQLLHTLYATDDASSFYVIGGVVVATGLLCWAGYVSTRDKTRSALTHTLVTIVLSGAWVGLCATRGLLAMEPVSWAPFDLPVPQRPIVDLWLIGGISLCVAWNMRQGIRVTEARDAKMRGEVLDDWTEAGFPGVKGTVKKRNEFRGDGIFTLPKGMTLEQLQKGSRQIESAFDWPMNSLSMIGYGDSSRRVRAVVMYKDPLAGSIEWPGVEL